MGTPLNNPSPFRNLKRLGTMKLTAILGKNKGIIDDEEEEESSRDL